MVQMASKQVGKKSRIIWHLFGICLTIVFSSNNKVDTKLDMHPRIIVIVGRRVTSSRRVRGKYEGRKCKTIDGKDSTNCNKVEWNGNKISTHKQ